MPETQEEPERPGTPDILRRILETKKSEVERLSGREDALRRAARAAPAALDFTSALRRPGEVALIGEVKRRSPGAGQIRPDLVPVEIAAAYRDAGAAALSVLTDGTYFGGSLEDLAAIRKRVALPTLRKDFSIDVRQLWEARSAGADAVLLIARILDDALLQELHREARTLGMSALVEVHDATELDRALRIGASLIGINNRDLGTFRTRLEVTLELLADVPPAVVLVSESGIRSGADVKRLGKRGVDAVLVGEALLVEKDPGAAAAALVAHSRSAR